MKKLTQILSYVLVAAAAVFITLAVSGNAGQWGKLSEIKSVIDAYFIEEYDEQTMEDTMASAMVAALGDRWSYYMTAEEYQQYNEQMANTYVGIGITITVREDGYIDVRKVDVGGPAEEAGVMPGDVLCAVEGKDVREMSLDQIRDMIRGEVGTQVNVSFLRKEETYTATIIRKHIQTVVVKGKLLDEGIGLVTIENFASRCKDETVKVIESLLEQGAKAIIFDVRNNPGGNKSELVNLLDYLLPEGPLFRSEDYTGAEFVDRSDAKCLKIPMAVLVNEDTYSAAEFFAAALSEYEAAIVVGTPTTGKGHFQRPFEISDGSALVISIGRYRTPNGVCLDGIGLTPDVVEEVDLETYQQIYFESLAPEADPQIQAAIAALKSQ